MRVAIAGAGNVGVYIANELVRNGHEVMLIEQQPAIAARVLPIEGLEVIVADACEVSSL